MSQERVLLSGTWGSHRGGGDRDLEAGLMGKGCRAGQGRTGLRGAEGCGGRARRINTHGGGRRVAEGRRFH